MSQITHNPTQILISELSLLLHQLPRLRPDNERPRYINSQHHILEVIAAVFATGHSSDLFATAFDPDANEIVLAKNGNPTEADLSFANQFFSFIVKPETNGATDLFTFLLQWRPEGLNKRIRQVHNAVVDPHFHDGLDSMLKELDESDEQVEFSSGQKFIQDNFNGKDPLFILKSCLDIISEQTQNAFDETTDMSTRSRTYFTIIKAADIIAHCSIMQKPFVSRLRTLGKSRCMRLKLIDTCTLAVSFEKPNKGCRVDNPSVIAESRMNLNSLDLRKARFDLKLKFLARSFTVNLDGYAIYKKGV